MWFWASYEQLDCMLDFKVWHPRCVLIQSIKSG